MSKVTVSYGNVTVEGTNQKEIFERLAEYQEVFGVTTCRGCGSEHLHHVVREHEGNKFFELRCGNCSAKLQFGQHKGADTLFPRRWVRWNRETRQEEELS